MVTIEFKCSNVHCPIIMDIEYEIAAYLLYICMVLYCCLSFDIRIQITPLVSFKLFLVNDMALIKKNISYHYPLPSVCCQKYCNM
jgi:hypothetical protein